MLQITAKTLDVTEEVVNEGQPGAFVSTTIHLLSGSGSQTTVERVRLGRDFPKSDLPKRDEMVTLNVVVRAYPTKGGAGYGLTALSRSFAKVPASV